MKLFDGLKRLANMAADAALEALMPGYGEIADWECPLCPECQQLRPDDDRAPRGGL